MDYASLRAQIDDALRHGATVDDIDERLIVDADLTDEQKAALWLYAFAGQRRRSQRRLVEDHLQLVGLG